mgnify:CR=1 FL=1
MKTKARRTQFEFGSNQGALKRNMPLLGVCGGQQLLHVVLGGRLIQHIPDAIDQALAHEQPNPRDEPGHKVKVARNTLFLARGLVEAQRRPWENGRRPCTPEQVRRAMGRIIALLGTPARLCRPRGYSPGWPLGRARKPVATYKVVYKACEEAEKVRKPRLSTAPRASVAA